MIVSQLELKKIHRKAMQGKDSEAFKSYLKRRNLREHKDIGYIPMFKIRDGMHTITNSVVTFIRDVRGRIQSAEIRNIAHKRYEKVTVKDHTMIPLYNIHNAFGKDYVIITESIFDAETILTADDSVSVVSVLRATVSNSALMYLGAMFDNIYILFDNDSAGVKSTESVIDFYEKHFPEINVEAIDYYGDDVNDVSTTDTAGFDDLMRTIETIKGEYE